MAEDLERLLSNPFEEDRVSRRSLLSADAESVQEGTHDAVRDLRIFRGPPETVLYAHKSSAETLQERLAGPLSPGAQQAISPYSVRLSNHLAALLKNFKVYVETCGEEILLKEVKRLERRYFDQGADEYQINFLKLKRIYEKIKTFQELVRTDWREVFKIIDTLTVIEETRSLARSVEKEILHGIPILMRRTDHFLEALHTYMGGGDESKDPVTGTYRLLTQYKPELPYTIGHLLGDEVAVHVSEELQEKQPLHVDMPETLQGSVAQSIVLDTREKILNKSSLIAAPILGSRDWNRTPAYSMEVPVRQYEECLENFKQSFIVHLEPSVVPVNAASSQVAARLRSGSGEEVLNDYLKLIFSLLDEIASNLVNVDFAGLDHPVVFLYHCGPIAFFNMLLITLKTRQIGEVQYIDRSGNAIREYPQELLKKLLIDWWIAKFASISLDEVDSYILFSRCMDIVRRDYRVIYNQGMQMRKKEQPHGTYAGLARWMKENRVRVFGIRRMEIFRRFIPGIFLNF